jgi:hypothetical protein
VSRYRRAWSCPRRDRSHLRSGTERVLLAEGDPGWVTCPPHLPNDRTENSALLVDGKFVAGEVTPHFRTASPFAFAGVKD